MSSNLAQIKMTDEIVIVSEDEEAFEVPIPPFFPWSQIQEHLRNRYGNGPILLAEPDPKDVNLCNNFLEYYENDDYEEDCCQHWLQRFEKHRNTIVVDLSKDDDDVPVPQENAGSPTERKLEDIWEAETPKRLRSNLEESPDRKTRKSVFADIIDLTFLDDDADDYEVDQFFSEWNDRTLRRKQTLVPNFY